MKIRHLKMFLIIVLFPLGNLSSQGALVAHYSFDDCTLSDKVGTANGLIFGPRACACGVRSNAVRFDGTIHFADFPKSISELIKADFTISFYVQFENIGTAGVDLFSLNANCGRDSIFSIRYIPSIKEIRSFLSDSPGNEVQLKSFIDDNHCWQYIAITKRGSIMKLYVNGVLRDEGASVSPLVLNNNDFFSIANSPCLSASLNPDVKFKGKIDELRFYNTTLSERQIQDADYRPDQILNRDTTIFKGESVLLITGGSCSANFSWAPIIGLNSPMSLNTLATPEVTTTYSFNINDANCKVSDKITINVVSQEELTCNDLMLPNAFTPNGDRVNDIFSISNSFLIDQLLSFEIFDKWGGRMFYSNTVDSGWDGSFRSEPAPPAAYVFKVAYTCQNQTFQKTGTLSLIR